MLRKSLVVGAIPALFSLPAAALHCPADIAAIDAAFAGTELDADVRGQVEAFRDEGQSLHGAGNHTESGHELAEAMRLILNSI